MFGGTYVLAQAELLGAVSTPIDGLDNGVVVAQTLAVLLVGCGGENDTE